MVHFLIDQRMEQKVVVGATEVMLVSGVDLRPPLSVVFVLHGRLGSRGDVVDLARQIRDQVGCVVAICDNPNHGARLFDEARNKAWPENEQHACDMYGQMLASMRDMQTMIDVLPGILGAEIGRTGVLGISQGGHTALLAFAHEPRLDVCCSLISSGDYELNMKKRYERLVAKAEKKGLPTPPPFEKLFPATLANGAVKIYDPINNVSKLAAKARPILMQNGKDDTLVPLECNLKLHGELEKEYEKIGRKEKLKHIVYENCKHETPPKMIGDAIDWLRSSL